MEPRLGSLQGLRDESTALVVDDRRKPARGFIYEAVLGGAQLLAKQSHFPRCQIAASLVVTMMKLFEKRQEEMSPDVDESRATCLSMVNMLQRAEDVLATRDAFSGKEERVLMRDVEEAVDDLVELLKTYENKNRLSKVAGTTLCKQRLEDAAAVVDGAFKKLNVSPFIAVLMFH